MYGCGLPVYAPGDSLANEYHVWDDYRTGGYFEPGTYRFEERVAVGTVDGDGKSASDLQEVDEEFTWGFDLTVEGAE